MILDRLILGGMQTNSYILADEDTSECAVFDPAADADKIMSLIEQKGLKVKYIILTHVHIDHIMALDKIKEITDAEIVVHADEADMLNYDGYTLASYFGTRSPEAKADMSVSHGDVLYLGKAKLEIIHTPGHTAGGMCVLCDDILISGDTLFAESIGRTDFPSGNHTQLISSIKDKLMTLDDKTQVYPGHGSSTTIGHERVYNPYL